MLVTIRYVADCPGLELAQMLVRESLIVIGHPDAEIRLELVPTEAVAQAWRFRGSPSFLLDGQDLFATDGAQGFGLACRIYPTPRGPRNCPTLGQLVEALDAVGYHRPSPT